MNYYPHHIGDYRAATLHLSNEEDLAYRRLLEMYYDTEANIPLDTQWVSRRLRLGLPCIESVLNDFFKRQESGWSHTRCDYEISEYNRKADVARANGKKGGRRKANARAINNPVGSQLVPTANPVATQSLTNHEPITNNQVLPAPSPAAPSTKGTRIPDGWNPSEELKAWAKATRPDLDSNSTVESFVDYWSSKSGRDATKLDWNATYRNWVKAQRATPMLAKVTNIMRGVI